MIVFSAPSGAGKSTIIKMVTPKIKNIKFSVSATTRLPRANEKNGVDYFFLTKEEFLRKIDEDAFVEHKNVYGNHYGTLKSYVDDELNKGNNVIFDVDVKGALAIKEKYKDASMIFILPPSIEVLEKRLNKRGTDDPDVIKNRLSFAQEEINKADKFDYKVINDDLEQAVLEIMKILGKLKVLI